VWVPPGASASADLADEPFGCVRDRRWPVLAATQDTTRTNEEIRDVAGAMASTGLSYDDGADTLGFNVAASGNLNLSSGSGTADTGVDSDIAVLVACGNNAGADIAFSLEDDGGTHRLNFEEHDSSVGNPFVFWKVVVV
jgi:hypothetical protein